MKSREKDKILILSGAFGAGHHQVAKAVHEAMPLRTKDAETVVIDFMILTHAFIYPFIHHVYMKGIKRFPNLYGYIYQKTRQVNVSSPKWKTTTPSLRMRRILKFLEEIQPSVVVSTFPFASREMSRLKAYGLINIPTVTIITDYTDHSFWIHPYTDQYIVGSSQVHHALNRKGIADSKISASGIPINPKFHQSHSRKELTSKFGMNAKMPTILVMGGGYGMIGNGLSTVQALNALPSRVQLIIVCGHNEKLRMQIMKELRYSKHQIHLTGYIDYVHELMAISDLIITKPGGITASEALAMELPMLIYNPIPGQEQDNAQFLVQIGVAMAAENLLDLCAKIVHLLHNQKRLESMKANAKRFQLRGSAFEAIDVIMRAKHQKPVQTFAFCQLKNT